MAYAYPPQPAYAMRTTAPIALHVVAIFQYLGGLAMLAVAALVGLTATDTVARWDVPLATRTSTVAPLVAIVVAVFAVTGLIAIVLGRKLQRGRNWARVVLTLLNVLSLASVAWQAYTTTSLLTPATIVSAAMPALFLILLNTRAARS